MGRVYRIYEKESIITTITRGRGLVPALGKEKEMDQYLENHIQAKIKMLENKRKKLLVKLAEIELAIKAEKEDLVQLSSLENKGESK